MVFSEIVAKFGVKVLPFVELVMLESQKISHKSFWSVYLRITTATAAWKSEYIIFFKVETVTSIKYKMKQNTVWAKNMSFCKSNHKLTFCSKIKQVCRRL
jgi:hypothetical protein